MIVYSVIIPTYNSVGTLKALLESLDRQDNDSFEVIVVDDASTDATPELVKQYDVRYERMAANSGPAAARNHGVSLAQGAWLIFTDADTEFRDDTINTIADVLDHSDADALVGTYAGKPANGGFMPRYKALWEYCTIDLALPLDERGLSPYAAWAPRPGIIQKSAFDALVGFDTRFRGADLEDLELGYRLHEAGYKIYFASEIRIKHHYPETLLKEIRPFARRCVIWMQMRAGRNKMDTAGDGSPRTALAHLCGFTATLCLLLGVVWVGFFLLGLGLLAEHWFLNRLFLLEARKEEGVFFAVRCALLTWLHSTVLGMAAGYGHATTLVGRGQS